MNGEQGSPDIVDACAVQSGRFSEVVNLHGTSCKAATDHVWTVICDHQRRSANLPALVSTYLGLPASLDLPFASYISIMSRLSGFPQGFPLQGAVPVPLL